MSGSVRFVLVLFGGAAPRDAVARGGWLAAVAGGARRDAVARDARRDEGAAGRGAGGPGGDDCGAARGCVAVRGEDADARAAAAAAELTHGRRRPPPLLTLETFYVSGVSRDVRQHRLRALLAEVTRVDVHAIVDVDRCGAATEVTLVAAAVPAFVAAAGREHAATVLRVLPGVDPWSPALLGPARCRALGGGERAAEVSAGYCRQRLLDKLAQLPRRGALRLPVRQALKAHVRSRLAAHPRGRAAATAAASPAAASLPGAAARVAARPAGAVSSTPVLVGGTGRHPARQSHADRRPSPPPPERHFGGAMGTASTTMEGIVAANPAAASSIAAATGAASADAAARAAINAGLAAVATHASGARGAVRVAVVAGRRPRRAAAAAAGCVARCSRVACAVPAACGRGHAWPSPSPAPRPHCHCLAHAGVSAAGGLSASPPPLRPPTAAAIADAVAAAAVALPSARRVRKRGAAGRRRHGRRRRDAGLCPRVPPRRPPAYRQLRVRARRRGRPPRCRRAPAPGPRSHAAALRVAGGVAGLGQAPPPARPAHHQVGGRGGEPAGAATRAVLALTHPHSPPATPGLTAGPAARVSDEGRHE
ncbi:hypothetical protein BU14_0396s0003 [Porphyra umbilicalis]|uniref:Uncharacterized protein n=1 Tax=Porphyra umbilicalis TaxID=2786 RepID=A0A1X6NWK1_PORUM|nr:hypothetical protein BU14_0396s0003 [Porphyra umbilicalis]|eukprot:OSX72900.1 hypothetical protein BU14_0396s0003 [Porphyra umbilicalis]